MDDFEMLFDKRIFERAEDIVEERSRGNDCIRVVLPEMEIWYKRVAHGWDATLDVEIRDRVGGPMCQLYRNHIRPDTHDWCVEFWNDLAYAAFEHRNRKQEEAMARLRAELPEALMKAINAATGER